MFKKALYDLKQAPRAWYDKLSSFLLQNGFTRGKVDTTLFVFENGQDFLLVQIYVDDIIFGATNESLCKKFSKLMQGEFEMSLIGELNFFLGLQIKQCQEGISQSKYTKELLKKFGIEEGRTVTTPMTTNIKLDKDAKGILVDKLIRGMFIYFYYSHRLDIFYALCLYARLQKTIPTNLIKVPLKEIFKYLKGTSSYGLFIQSFKTFIFFGITRKYQQDCAGDVDDRKSTPGGCVYLGNNVSWYNKKQSCVSLSTVESEYIALGSFCSQILWMRQMLTDNGVEKKTITAYCDNSSAINISKNPVQHSRTKHIDIRHHFIRDLVENKIVIIDCITIENQIADIFTKTLDFQRFNYLKLPLGVCSF
ncbi:hypothetical protein DH2020_028378 [Rehmannia glutinosa]|uniref:Reverse transcriptase Ty1/copia-type domain-containing protein n=1 Tax=Rehmannia glutinosa TaxID=99300 RepID=A0ABR0VRI1_REHGL